MKNLVGRRLPRKPFASSVVASSPGWEHPLLLSAVNLSKGGIFLACDRPISTGSEVWLEIPLLQGAMIGVSGSVAHVVSAERARLDGHVAGVGVRFDRLEPTRRALIDELVDGLSTSAPLADTAHEAPTVADAQTVLEAELGRLRELLPWQVLEISRDATLEQASAAFRNLSKRYHPDTLGALVPANLRHLASECFLAVRRAYEHFRRMGLPIAEPVPVRGTPRPPSSKPISLGMPAQKPRPAARPFLVPSGLTPTTGATPPSVPILALEPAPSESERKSPRMDGKALVRAALESYERENHREARTLLAAALRAQPRNRVLLSAHHVAVGCDLAARGRLDEARQWLQKALQVDLSNTRAVAALRALSAERAARRRQAFQELTRAR